MLSPKQLAELLDVSIHSLKKWRYLPEKDPRHLPAAPLPDGNPQQLFYKPEDILKWVQHRRNAKFADRIVAALAPPEVYQKVLPQPETLALIQALRPHKVIPIFGAIANELA